MTQAERQRRYYERHPERRKDTQLRYDHGVGLEYLNQHLINQNFKCAICECVLDKSSKNTSPHIDHDHDHTTDQKRGVLCHSCNSALGLFKDSIEILGKAVGYLQKWRRNE